MARHDISGRMDVGMSLGTSFLFRRSEHKNEVVDLESMLGLVLSHTNSHTRKGIRLWVDYSQDIAIVCRL